MLHLRAAFGGMPCDVSMMRAAAETWLRRFAGRGGMPPSVGAVATASAAAGAEATKTPAQHWLDFLWRSFSPPAVPPLALLPPGATTAAAASAVGRMTQEDVPLSAVDFHVSSVAEELMGLPAVAREARKAARAAGEDGNCDAEAAEERLRRAMWLFRSSRNVRSLPLGGGGGGGTPLRRRCSCPLRPPRPQRRLRSRQGAPGAASRRARRPAAPVAGRGGRGRLLELGVPEAEVWGEGAVLIFFVFLNFPLLSYCHSFCSFFLFRFDSCNA